MKLPRAKDISGNLKEILVSGSAIMILLGSIAEGINTYWPKDEKEVRDYSRPILRDHYRFSNINTVGVFLYAFNDDGHERLLIDFVSDEVDSAKEIAVRYTEVGPVMGAVNEHKKGKCSVVMLEEYPVGDTLRVFFEKFNAKGFSSCPVIINGKTRGSVMVVWKEKENIDEIHWQLRRTAVLLETVFKDSPTIQYSVKYGK